MAFINQDAMTFMVTTRISLDSQKLPHKNTFGADILESGTIDQDLDHFDRLSDGGFWNLSTVSQAPMEGSDNSTARNGEGDLNWGVLALSLLIVATALGNVLVCLAVCWDKRLQNMTNYFLMSLAIADLLVAILVMPLGLVVELFGFFPLTPGICVIWASTDVLMCTASIWHMCTMSMDRYFTLKYPMKYGRNKTKLMVALKITFVWVVSIAICSPICIMGFLDYSNVYNDNQCAPAIPNFLIYGSVFAFYVPLFIMVVTYTLTTRILCSNQRFMKSLVYQQQVKKVKLQNGVNPPNNVYMSNGGVRNPASPGLQVEGQTLDMSMSERASFQESEEFLEKGTDSHKASDESQESNRDHGSQAQSPISPKDKVFEQSSSGAKDSPVSTQGFTCNGSILNFPSSDHFSGKPMLSVSQPHLPSMGNYGQSHQRQLLSLSSSHHNLNSSPGSKGQLTVSHLESVQNFESILSLNSMLSHNWGSEAWSDFDEPAMLEKISLIEAEMDQCLTVPTSEESQCKPRFGLNSESDADSPRSYTESPSLVVSESPQRHRTKSARVFSYPPQGSAFVDGTPSYSKLSGSVQGSQASLNKLNLGHSLSTSSSVCTSPVSQDGLYSSRITAQRPDSPAIFVEDTTVMKHENSSGSRNSVNINIHDPQPPSALQAEPAWKISTGNKIIDINIDDVVSQDTTTSFPSDPSGTGQDGQRRQLELDLDTGVLSAQPLTPVITTSPASSQSQHSVLSDSAKIDSPGSSQRGYITIELKPQACYLYRVGRAPSTSPWRLPTQDDYQQTCDDESESVTRFEGGEQCSIKIDSHSHSPTHSPQHNGFTCSISNNHLTPHMKTPSSRSSSCKQLDCRSSSLVDTELVSQEVDRSTDDTLSEPISCSTTSTSRYHLPSLSIHWSAKKGGSHGIKTFLRQYSFRKGGGKFTVSGQNQLMSKRTASNEKKASKVLGIIFGVFFVLWTPFFLVNFVTAICVPCMKVITPPLMASLVWLGYLSSLANPIIYTMFNTSFRRAFYNILTCRLKRKSQRHRSGGSHAGVKGHRTNTAYFSNYTTSERRSRSHKHVR